MPKPFPPWEIRKISQFYSLAEIHRRDVPEICWEWLVSRAERAQFEAYVQIPTSVPFYQEFVDRVKYELDKQDTIFGEVEVPKWKQKAKWKDDVTEWEKENFGTVSSQIPSMSVTEYKRQQALNQQQVSVEEQARRYQAANSLSDQIKERDVYRDKRTATEISMIDADLRKQVEMMEALKATLDFVREKAVEKGYYLIPTEAKPKPEPVPTLKPKRKFQLDL